MECHDEIELEPERDFRVEGRLAAGVGRLSRRMKGLLRSLTPHLRPAVRYAASALVDYSSARQYPTLLQRLLIAPWGPAMSYVAPVPVDFFGPALSCGLNTCSQW